MRFCRSLGRRFFCQAQQTAKEVPLLPGGLPLLGNIFQIKDVNYAPDWIVEQHDQMGEIFKINLMGETLISVSDSDLYKQILKDTSGRFEQSNSFHNLLGYYLPQSVIVVRGDQWKRIRNELKKASDLHKPEVALPTIVKQLNGLIKENIPIDEEIDMLDFSSGALLNAFCKFMFDHDIDHIRNENDKEFLKAMEFWGSGITLRGLKLPLPMMWKLPIKHNRDMDNAGALMRERAQNLWKKTKNETEINENNFLHQLKNSDLTEEEIIDQICTLFIAGFDTTSNAMAFLLHHLAKNPNIQEKLYEELSIFEKIEDLSNIKLKKLEYLNALINEGQRLTPIAPGIERSAMEDMVLHGYQIRKNDTFYISWKKAIDAQDWWENSSEYPINEFHPERWLGLNKPPRLKFLPFGFGGRICIGKELASMEMRVYLALMIKNYTFSSNRKLGRKLSLAISPGETLIKFYPRDTNF